MPAVITFYYRTFELPWDVDPEERERFRRLWRTALGILLLFSIAMPWLPVPERPLDVPPAIPPRIAQLVLERATPPPPPPPPPQPEREIRPKPDQKTVPRPESDLARTQNARKKASQAGLLPFVDQLADLRDQFEVRKDDLKPLASAKGEGDTPRAERSLITARTGTLTGGINTAGVSRGFGSGSGTLDGHGTTRMQVPFGGSGSGSALAGGGAGDDVSRAGGGKKASRSREEIELVFDRNKAAIYALYNRALRDNPALLGKVVFELTIAPWGEVTDCRIVSSELKDSELERKLVARIRMFKFADKDVEAMTTTKPIEFFPA